MKLTTFGKIGLIALIATSAVSCRDVVVKVSKKGKAGESNTSAVPSESTAETTSSIQDIEGAINTLKDLKKEDAVAYILKRLKTGWRNDFRKGMRDLRATIVRNAMTEHSYENKLVNLAESVSCQKLEKQDFSMFKGYEGLGIVLEGSMLAHLSKDHAKNLNKDLPAKMDDITRIFLFELGVNSKGESKVTVDGNKTTMESSVVWKVIHEKGDADDLIDADNMSVALLFTRVFVDEKPVSFKLEAKVAKGLFEDKVVGDTYYLTINNTYDQDADGAKSLTVSMENGIKDAKKVYSREIVFARDGANKELYSLKDTGKKGLEGEFVRQTAVDFKAMKSCKNKALAGGTDTPSKGGEDDKGDKGNKDDKGRERSEGDKGAVNAPAKGAVSDGKDKPEDSDYPTKSNKPSTTDLSKGTSTPTPTPTPAITNNPPPSKEPGQNQNPGQH